MMSCENQDRMIIISIDLVRELDDCFRGHLSTGSRNRCKVLLVYVSYSRLLRSHVTCRSIRSPKKMYTAPDEDLPRVSIEDDQYE